MMLKVAKEKRCIYNALKTLENLLIYKAFKIA